MTYTLTFIMYHAGPFDELAVSPGEFTNPFERPAHRITRSYVSSISAVVNGTELKFFSALLYSQLASQDAQTGVCPVSWPSLSTLPPWTTPTRLKYACTRRRHSRPSNSHPRHVSQRSSSPSPGCRLSQPALPSRMSSCTSHRSKSPRTPRTMDLSVPQSGMCWSVQRSTGAQNLSALQVCSSRGMKGCPPTQTPRNTTTMSEYMRTVSASLRSIRTALGYIGQRSD